MLYLGSQNVVAAFLSLQYSLEVNIFFIQMNLSIYLKYGALLVLIV